MIAIENDICELRPDGYDPARSLSLEEARAWLPGRRNRPACVETLRAWADRTRGYRPQGPRGPRLLLPTVRISGEFRTMPEWVAWFQAQRVALGGAS